MKSLKLVVGGALVLASLMVGVAQASAAVPAIASANASNRHICSGTLTSPGLLSGVYPDDVSVVGFCVVDGGPTLIRGDLNLAPGSALNATFARNDVSGTGMTSLTVRGNVTVASGATLDMGCEPQASPCTDDPAASTGGTLTGQNEVSSDIVAAGALALIVHASTIRGDIRQIEGGGGLSCAPPATGVFSLLHSPVFSDYEDNTISGDLEVTDVQSCWFGALRNLVRGDFTYSNNSFGDPDASEVLTNAVSGDLRCFADSPAVAYGDSAGMPNRVGGDASGQCSFRAESPNPAPSGPLAPISVRK